MDGRQGSPIFLGIALVVSTHLKNISQIGSFPQEGLKIKIFETTTQYTWKDISYFCNSLWTSWWFEAISNFLRQKLLCSCPTLKDLKQQNNKNESTKFIVEQLLSNCTMLHQTKFLETRAIIWTKPPQQWQRNPHMNHEILVHDRILI